MLILNIILVSAILILIINNIRLYLCYASIVYYCIEKGYEIDVNDIKKAMYKVAANIAHDLKKLHK